MIVDDLKIELVTEGLSFPTSISFVDDDKILVLEKNTGLVRLISDGVLQEKPVLKLPVENFGPKLWVLCLGIIIVIQVRVNW